MQNYRCIYLDENKKTVRKTLAAISKQEVFSRLKQSNNYVIDIQEIKPVVNKKKKIKAKELIVFCRQASIMLKSGVPIVEVLSILADKATDKNTKDIYLRLSENIQKGVPLSESMSEEGVFPNMLVNMIEAGEAGGILEDNLEKMSVHYEKDNKMHNQVKQAMTYPIILSVVAVVVVILLVSFVLPTFFSMYTDLSTLPWPTKAVIFVSELFTKQYIVVIIFVIVMTSIISLLRKSKTIRLKIDEFKLKGPIIGKLNRTIYSSRFARGFASLYTSGVSMLETLDIVSKLVGNKYIEAKFENIIDEVSKGQLVSVSIERANVFDAMFISMLHVGEEAGSLEVILNKTADYYDEEASNALTRLVGLIEPILLIVMALVIGFIVIAIMMPMYGMLEQIY